MVATGPKKPAQRTRSLHDVRSYDKERGNGDSGPVRTHFGEIHQPLLRYIAGTQIAVGCVAWVTSKTILAQLAACERTALVVQKENFWKKPDSRGQRLRSGYERLRGDMPLSAFPLPLPRMDGHGGTVPAISCVGVSSTRMYDPLMHHKFLVRCVRHGDRLKPLAVWVGSANFSEGANNSFENAVEIHDPAVAESYLVEFARVAALSEPMMWRSAQPNPQFKLKQRKTG